MNRKFNYMTGPVETNNRKEIFEILKAFLAQKNIKLNKITRTNICGMQKINLKGTYQNGLRFHTSIEDRSKIKDKKCLDYILSDISRSMIK